MVNKVKQVLKDHFHSAAAMQVVELEVSKKYMVTEIYGSMLNINLNQQQTPPTAQADHQQRHVPIPPALARVKTNVLSIKEKYMFLWKVAATQVSLPSCHGLLQEMGRYVIPRYSPGTFWCCCLCNGLAAVVIASVFVTASVLVLLMFLQVGLLLQFWCCCSCDA